MESSSIASGVCNVTCVVLAARYCIDFQSPHMHHVIIVALLQYSLSFRGLCSALYDPSVLLLVHVLGLCAFNTRHNRVSSSAYVMQ